MEIFVLIKEVPDMKKVRFDSERGVVDRSSAPGEINPFDENVLQAAVALKQKYKATVCAISMGPAKAAASLRDAYARGADRCLLLSDRHFGGSDTFATASVLSAALKKAAATGLILCGEKSVDGDTAQVGAEVAELLGIPHACYVDRIAALSDTEVTVEIEELCGRRQIRTMALPALISMTKNAARPLLPTVRRKLLSLEIPVPVQGLDDLAGYIDTAGVGAKGSPTKVVGIEIPPAPERICRLFREDLPGFVTAAAGAIQESAR